MKTFQFVLTLQFKANTVNEAWDQLTDCLTDPDSIFERVVNPDLWVINEDEEEGV